MAIFNRQYRAQRVQVGCFYCSSMSGLNPTALASHGALPVRKFEEASSYPLDTPMVCPLVGHQGLGLRERRERERVQEASADVTRSRKIWFMERKYCCDALARARLGYSNKADWRFGLPRLLCSQWIKRPTLQVTLCKSHKHGSSLQQTFLPLSCHRVVLHVHPNVSVKHGNLL